MHVDLESSSFTELTEAVCSLTGRKKEICFEGDEYVTFSSSFVYSLLIWLRFERRSIWMSSLRSADSSIIFHVFHMFMCFTLNRMLFFPSHDKEKRLLTTNNTSVYFNAARLK